MSNQFYIPFEWDHSQPDSPFIHFRLYEKLEGEAEGQPIVDNIGALDYSLLMTGKPPGQHEYWVTTISTKYNPAGWESEASNSLIVDFTQPAAPTNFRIGTLAEASVSGSVG
jgi:hypothetical protein